MSQSRISRSRTSHSRGPSEVTTLDPDRQAALLKIDNAKFSWIHVKIVLVAGVGFFTDAYDIFAINIASTMIGMVYGTECDSAIQSLYNPQETSCPGLAYYDQARVLNATQDLGLKISTQIGTFVGQLLFGWLADVYGRKRMYGIELVIMITATFAQALAAGNQAVSIIGALIVWRFIMGVGVGGDYPLSAVIASEFASKRNRGRLMTAVFANQGWGQLTSSLVALVIVRGYRDTLHNAGTNPIVGVNAVDYMWRLFIGLGCVPAAIALYFRLTITETPRFTMDVRRNVRQANVDIDTFLTPDSSTADVPATVQRVQPPKPSRKDFVRHFSQWSNMKVLIGTAYSWFALDIAFYGLNLNTSIILRAINYSGTGSSTPLTGGRGVYQSLHNISVGNVILSVGGLIPGFWVSFALIDRWGRRPIQLMGFIMLTILFFIMGFAYIQLNPKDKSTTTTNAFFALVCIANFFENFGPNTTTFVIPGEAFPTRYRSTAHGISAASGKLGSIVTQITFSVLRIRHDRHHGAGSFDPSSSIHTLLQIFAFFMLSGVASTLLLPETMQKSLEELSDEQTQQNGTGIVHRADRRPAEEQIPLQPMV